MLGWGFEIRTPQIYYHPFFRTRPILAYIPPHQNLFTSLQYIKIMLLYSDMDLGERIANRDPRYIILSNEIKRQQLIAEVAAFIGAAAFMQPDVLMYLDKSARPICWIVNKVWKTRFPNKPKPETKFINFGKERTIVSDLVSEHGLEKVEYLDEPHVDAAVQQLREDYGKRNGGTYLDGKRIWLVDEFSYTGSSLIAARILLTQAIGDELPKPIFTHTVLSREPVWYTNKWMTGVQDYHEPESFLSYPVEDSLYSSQLRGELRSIADDIAEQYSEKTV